MPDQFLDSSDPALRQVVSLEVLKKRNSQEEEDTATQVNSTKVSPKRETNILRRQKIIDTK